jgi:tetratricopeptide (TPR) repeat protein
MYFQRFSADDPTRLQLEIEEGQRDLQLAQRQGDVAQAIELATEIGGLLTIARREAEACSLLLEYLPQARVQGVELTTGWLLLNLATANQYLGYKAEANSAFSESLAKARTLGDRELEHYVLHHWGRSLVEDKEFSYAKECFEQALALRVSLNEPRQASTRRALEALETMYP